ncbi:MAG: D-alanyl-D-alanine carboxypeptidase/D-alanyl-D-alanine-endopeptidase, partial [Crocinitomicaceae bacterium]|nr:D-alanyl-D-alanine carboxypeptidase/D-alanyl-D-alanine-endopeptidase [Crocinitomicaceae bacterium]
MKIKLVLILSFSFSFLLQLFAQQNIVQQAIDKFVSAGYNSSAAISFHALDINSGEEIAAHNPMMAIAPASTMKLFTTASAFHYLGGLYRPTTTIFHDGNLDSNGVLNGNLWVKTNGDPSLGSRFFEKNGEESLFLYEWIIAIQQYGIKKIDGSIIVDGSDFGYNGAPEGWTWGDMGNYYGSGPAGTVLFDNSTFLGFKTSKKVGDSTWFECMRPHIEGLKLRNEVVTSSNQSDNSYVFGAPFSFDRFIQGTLPLGKTLFEVKASIPDPELLLAQELQFELAQFIEVTGTPFAMRQLLGKITTPNYAKMKQIIEHEGKSLENIAYWVNMKSVNLFAEQLLCWIGYKKSGKGTTENGIYWVNKLWQPVIGNGIRIADGSGLSRKNAASANHFCLLLQ